MGGIRLHHGKVSQDATVPKGGVGGGDERRGEERLQLMLLGRVLKGRVSSFISRVYAFGFLFHLVRPPPPPPKKLTHGVE